MRWKLTLSSRGPWRKAFLCKSALTQALITLWGLLSLASGSVDCTVRIEGSPAIKAYARSLIVLRNAEVFP